LIANHHFNLDLNDDFSITLREHDTLLAVCQIDLIHDTTSLLVEKPDALHISNAETIQTELGHARRVVASATFGSIQARLSIDRYTQWEDAFILQWEFKNQGDSPLKVDISSLPHLRLGEALRQGIWTMQGVAVDWGQDFAMQLPESFARDNFLGHNDNEEGGGVPLIYCWNKKSGLALAHIEVYQALWHMPVQSDPKQGINITLQDRRPTEIAPGDKLQSLRVLLSLHHGDFFEPLHLYSQIMSKQGLSAPATNEEDYQPAWCSWGYEFDVLPEEVTGVLPVLKEMGITWLTLDDRWFDHYGDWNPRADTFPGGNEQVREMVNKIHAEGAYAQIWWYPLCVEDGVGQWDTFVYGTSQTLSQHPNWVVLNRDGSVARNNRGLAIICPGLPEIQQYTIELTRRFIQEWGFDGHKLDNIYTVQPCYNPTHQHRWPEESVEGFAEIYRSIFETTRQLKPYSVNQICPCGTPITHTLIPWMDQAVTADPISSEQIRQRVKFYKGLLGSRFAVFADHVELSDGGGDFASEIGTGGIPATKFTWPEDQIRRLSVKEWPVLTTEKKNLWTQWMGVYNAHPLAKGEYLNLYDLAFDYPEAHVIRYNEKLYYAFYTNKLGQKFSGKITLRGLEPKEYQVLDYIQDRLMRTVTGPSAELEVDFTSYLLLEVFSNS
jgi:alpha-galactosidase